MTEEKITPQSSGWLMLFLALLLLVLTVVLFIYGVTGGRAVPVISSIVLLLIVIVLLTGLFAVEPNQCVVLLLFGEYKGTEIDPGISMDQPVQEPDERSLCASGISTANG